MSVSRISAVLALAGALAGLAACGRHGGGAGSGAPGGSKVPATATAKDRAAEINEVEFAEPRPLAKGASYDPSALKLQVLLDRARFSPGAIDGRFGDNIRRAVAAYELGNGVAGDGTPTKEVWNRLSMADPRPVVRAYIIDADDVAGPFSGAIPKDFPGMAALERMGYRSPAEELAESFHMDVSLLRALNPKARFVPGETVLVADRGGDDLGVDLGRVEVDRKAGEVRAYGLQGKLIAAYPASIGSRSCPPVAGTLQVAGIDAQPTYSYDSDSVGVAGTFRGRSEIAAGPNNPIGVVWINLSKDGYGIHGAPDSEAVGRPAGHGCVAVTNWDARELARGVKPGMPVVFR